jgi:hypothetical protein
VARERAAAQRKHSISGDLLRVVLPPAYAKTLIRSQFTEDDRNALGAALQAHLGAERAFVESVTVEDGEEPTVLVRLRYPWNEDDRTMTSALRTATLAWGSRSATKRVPGWCHRRWNRRKPMCSASWREISRHVVGGEPISPSSLRRIDPSVLARTDPGRVMS